MSEHNQTKEERFFEDLLGHYKEMANTNFMNNASIVALHEIWVSTNEYFVAADGGNSEYSIPADVLAKTLGKLNLEIFESAIAKEDIFWECVKNYRIALINLYRTLVTKFGHKAAGEIFPDLATSLKLELKF